MSASSIGGVVVVNGIEATVSAGIFTATAVPLVAGENTITAIVGPSGQGKTTFLMILNRLWESIPEARMEGGVKILLDIDQVLTGDELSLLNKAA